MFCTQCGRTLSANSRFCNHCGAPVAGDSEAATAAEELAAGERETAAAAGNGAAAARPAPGQPRGRFEGEALGAFGAESQVIEAQPPAAGTARKEKRRGGAWTYLLPVCSVLLVLIGAAADYAYQQRETKQAESLLRTGERLALAGRYAEARTAVSDGLGHRPDHPALLNDRDVLTDVLKLNGELEEAAGKAGAKQYDAAIKDVRALRETIAARDGAVYKKLGAQAAAKEEAFVVGQVKGAIAGKQTVNELLPLLDALKPYAGAEAKAAVKNVKQKIVDLSYEQSSAALQSRNFEKALAIVDGALKQDDHNAKLLGLRETIEAKRKAFEEAERRRIQQAIEASTKEDLDNRTNGVQLVSIQAGLDEFGYFRVSGEVKNVATRPVISVTVYYDLKDMYGNVLYHDTVYVSPFYLALGDKGNFSNSYYFDGSMAKAAVTRLEWQLE